MSGVQTTTEWARQNGEAFHWHTALDNHEPPRDFTSGTLWTYDLQGDARGSGIVIEDATFFKDAGRKSVFLIDDGHSVRVFYAASWHPEEKHLMLHPFPVNFNEDGSPMLRDDNGEPVDFTNWILGPRHAYHLKVSPR